ncbi:hypothetical protein ACLKA6_009779 [Drosophila palustris]
MAPLCDVSVAISFNALHNLRQRQLPKPGTKSTADAGHEQLDIFNYIIIIIISIIFVVIIIIIIIVLDTLDADEMRDAGDRKRSAVCALIETAAPGETQCPTPGQNTSGKMWQCDKVR